VLLKIAQVAELVDALDSKSSFFGSAGSIPALSTNNPLKTTFLKGYLIFRATQRATFII
jgi:hypothetical protein